MILENKHDLMESKKPADYNFFMSEMTKGVWRSTLTEETINDANQGGWMSPTFARKED